MAKKMVLEQTEIDPLQRQKGDNQKTMNRKRQGKTATVGLALCVAILALLAVFMDFDEVSPARGAPTEETPVIGPWRVGSLDTMSTGECPPVLSVDVTPQPTPELVQRYSSVAMSADERQELAEVIYLEAGNQCAEGQQAVAEVVLNRVISTEFPDTVHDVLHQGEDTSRPQFSTIGNLALADPAAAQYDAIDAALYGPSILPEDVVFFSRNGENDRVWGKIQDHVFCYKYIWE